MVLDFAKGAIIGFSVAAPVGPVALLILRRTLSEGRLSGVVSGLGAASADLLCGLVAAFGLSAITALIETHHDALRLFGGIFMIVLGVTTMRARDPAAANRPLHERNLVLAYVFTLLLTLSNPITLLGMVGMVAASGAGGPNHSFMEIAALGAGVFLGSALWWLILCSIAGWLGKKLGHHTLHVINVIAGGLILGFGLWQLVWLAVRFFARAS